MSQANELTIKILNFLFRNGIFAWRQNNLGLFDKRLGIYRPAGGKKGVSDILCCHQSWLICIEIKIGKDSLSLEQEGFLENIEKAGGIAMVVKTFKDFENQWTDYLTKRSF